MYLNQGRTGESHFTPTFKHNTGCVDNLTIKVPRCILTAEKDAVPGQLPDEKPTVPLGKCHMRGFYLRVLSDFLTPYSFIVTFFPLWPSPFFILLQINNNTNLSSALALSINNKHPPGSRRFTTGHISLDFI